MFHTSMSTSDDEAAFAAKECAFFRDALMHSPFGVFMTTPTDQFTFANHAMARILGYATPDDLMTSVTDIATQVYCDPADRSNLLEQLETREDLADQECRVLKKDGSVIWLGGTLQAVRDEQGQIIWYRGYVSDITKCKETENTLERTGQKYRELVENINDVVYDVGLDGRMRYLSPSARNIFDDAESLIGRPFLDIIDPQDREQARANWAKMTQGALSTNEYRLLLAPGKTVWVRTSSRPAFHDGTIVAVVGVLQDITDRKLAEEALRMSEERYRVIFQNSPLGMILFDSTGTIVDCNAAFELLMGAPREKLIGFNTAQDSTPEMRATIQKALHGEVSIFEGAYTSVTGGISRMLRVIFNPISNQTPSGLIATLEDISERKRMEEAIFQEKTILHSILEDILAGYWDWEVGSAHKYLSPSLKRMFGYDDHELPNTYETWLGLILPEDRALVLEAIKRHADSRGRMPFNVEVRFRHKDGHIVWVICAGRVIRWSDTGQPLRMVGCHVDISRQKDVEEALLLAKKEADAANRIKSEFLANMSHELRTPLNGVMGILDLLGTTGLNPEQEEYTSMGMQACRRLANLLTDILDLSRIEAGVLHIQKVPLSLREIFRQTEDLFSPTAKAQDMALELLIHPGVPDILLGDGVRLHQVLTNLVGNALKFTAHGGVTVEASALPARQPGRCHILFSVADSGIGIADEKISQLFQPFSQIDTGITRAYQGAGLGLSICKRLVALMGGTISMVSELERGTTFYFTVAFDLEAEHHDHLAQPDALIPQCTGLRVLLVEDDTFSSAVTGKMLEKYAILVEQVENGQQALAALGKGGFDLVLMDIRMPVMDGVTAVRAIRTGAAGKDAATIPIIALTAHAMDGDRATFLEAGMNDYVSKPVIMSELIFAITKVLATT